MIGRWMCDFQVALYECYVARKIKSVAIAVLVGPGFVASSVVSQYVAIARALSLGVRYPNLHYEMI